MTLFQFSNCYIFTSIETLPNKKTLAAQTTRASFFVKCKFTNIIILFKIHIIKLSFASVEASVTMLCLAHFSLRRSILNFFITQITRKLPNTPAKKPIRSVS